MSRNFKRFISLFVAIVMLVAMSSVALADCDFGHKTTLPVTSEQAVTLTILTASDGTGGGSEVVRLPSEVHVRVKWTKQDGVYNATYSDSSSSTGFKNFKWDCVKLQYVVNTTGTTSNGQDVRTSNWTTEPSVGFEVTNASTPDHTVSVKTSIKGTDSWASFMTGTSLTNQATTFGTKNVAPVLRANMGTGVNSYEQGNNAAHANYKHNTISYDYDLEWDYTALNQRALDLYLGTQGATGTLTNTFVVTVDAIVSGN